MIDNAIHTNQTYLTKEEVETVSDTQFEKINEALVHYTKSISSEKRLVETKVKEVSKGILDILKVILDDCHTQLRYYFQVKKKGVTHSLDIWYK